MTLLVALSCLVTGAGAGAVAWRAIAMLTGGTWGVPLEPALRRMALLLAPGFVLSVAALFAAQDAHVAWYVRTAGAFLTWAVCAVAARRAPGPVLIAWLCATTVYAMDWLGTPAAGWHSSALGIASGVGQLATALCLAALVGRAWPTLRDLAGLFVVLALGWAYLAGIDYLTAWVADLPEETRWYLARMEAPYAALIVAAVMLHVLLPLALIVVRRLRERRATFRWVAASMLAGEACHVAWMVLP